MQYYEVTRRAGDGEDAEGPTVLEAIILLDTVVTYKQTDAAAAGTWGAVDALLQGKAKLPAFSVAKEVVRKYSLLTCQRHDVCPYMHTLFADLPATPNFPATRNSHRTKCPRCGTARYQATARANGKRVARKVRILCLYVTFIHC
jgi:hypothetical protein